jgi:phosphate uptake regulator
MKRKVNLVGQNTLTVSIPSKWVKSQGLQKGDELNLDIEGRNVIISSDEHKSHKAIEVSLGNYDKRLTRLCLNNIYRLGYNHITVQYKLERQLRYITDFCRDKVQGFEITNRGKNYCVIENIFKVDEEKYDILYRRVFLLVHEMMEYLHSCLKTREKIDMEIVESCYSKINQYVNFCLRTLNKEKVEGIFSRSYLLLALLMIPSTLNRMAKGFLTEDMSKFSPVSIGIYKEIMQCYKKFYELYFKRDIDEMNNLNAELEVLIKEKLVELNKNSTKNDLLFTNYLSQVVRFMLMLMSPATMHLLDESI